MRRLGRSVSLAALAMGLGTVETASAQSAPVLRLPRPAGPPLPIRPLPAPANGQPDLIVAGIREDGGQIVADIRNVGDGSAGATKVTLFVAGRQAAELDLSPLRAGETRTLRFDRPSGATSIQVMVDRSNSVAESNEANNRPPNFALSEQPPAIPLRRLPIRPPADPVAAPRTVTVAPRQDAPSLPARTTSQVQSAPDPGRRAILNGRFLQGQQSPAAITGKAAPTAEQPKPPTLAPASLTGPTPDESALLARMGKPGIEQAGGPGLRATTVPVLLLNGQPAPDQFRCASGSRSGDGVSLTIMRDIHYVLHFRCTAPGPLAEKNDFAIVLRRGANGPLAPARGPRRLGRGEPSLPAQASRAWKEVSTCLDAFDKYRGGDLAWDVAVIGNYPRCSTVAGNKLWAIKPLAANPPQPNVGLLNAAITAPQTVRDLIEGQRPERLSGYSERTMEGEGYTQTLFDLRDRYFNVPGQKMENPPNGIAVPNYPMHFAFLTKDKPRYDSAVLQLVDRSVGSDKRFVPTASIKFAKPSPNVQTAAALYKPGALKMMTGGDRCAAMMAPPKLVGMVVGKLRSRQAADARQFGWGLDGPAWVSDFVISPKEYGLLLGGRQSGRYQLRVVPAKIVKGAFVPKCMGDPSDGMPINVGMSPAQVADQKAYYAAAAQKALDDQASKISAAAAAALPGGAQGSSPAIIDVIGWMPPDNVAATVMTDVPVVNFNNPDEDDRIDAARNISEKDPARFLSMPHADVYHVKQAYPYVTWPDRFGPLWRSDRLYNPAEFERAQKADAALDDWYDYLGAAANTVSFAYGALQQGIVDGVAYAVTAGQCDPNVPGEPPVKDSAACAVIKGVAKTGLQVAMSSVGLPPSIPNVPQLIDEGTNYFAAFAVDTVIGLQPELAAAVPDSARAMLTSYIKDSIKKQMGAMKCAQPTNFADYKAQGYAAVDPVTLCGFKLGSTTSFARIERLPTTETTATLFLRIRPNPKAVGYDPNITIYTNSVQVGADAKDPRKGGPKGWENAFQHVGYGFQPLRMAKPLKLNMNDVPAEGIVVPIVYTYPEELMYWAYRQSGYCPESMFQSCWVQGAKAFWRHILYDSAQKLTVNASYRFAPDVQVKGADGQIGSAPAVTGYAAGQLVGNLGHVVNGLTYGIPTYDVEPGFRLRGTTNKSGLPTYDTEASFDMGKEY